MSGLKSLIKSAGDATAGKGTISVLYGEAGLGKTTIAAMCFPRPLFIPIEADGIRSLPDEVAVLPAPPDSATVIQYLSDIYEEVQAGTFEYDTVVLDSVSHLDTMIVAEVLETHGVSSLGDVGGFGKGYSEATGIMEAVKGWCNAIVEYGIHIVGCAHVGYVNVDLPDKDPYSRFILQLGKGSTKCWLNQVSACIHVRESVTRNKDKKTGSITTTTVPNMRILDMVPKASNSSKNRFGVASEIMFEYNPEAGQFTNPLEPIYRFTQRKEAVQ